MELHADQPVVTAGVPLGKSPVVMIMIHGRNATPPDILGLSGAFGHPEFTYMAPTAANRTWYPHGFMSELESNEPWLSSALEMLHGLVDRVLAAGTRREHLILLGFSQGACLTTEFAARNAARYGGVVAYSGGLVGPEGTPRDYEGSLEGTPVFLGCSDIDAHIPLRRVEETETVLRRMDADVTKRIYPGMGHLVNEDEVAFTRSLMDAVLRSATSEDR